MTENFNEAQDVGRAGRQVLVWGTVSAVGSLIVLGVVLYAAFWLPYRQPEPSLPHTVEVLPMAQEPPTREVLALSEYVWVDRDAGVVRIPIEVAMNIVAGGLPVRPDAEETAREWLGRKVPTDAGSGRFVTRPDEEAAPATARVDSGE